MADGGRVAAARRRGRVTVTVALFVVLSSVSSVVLVGAPSAGAGTVRPRGVRGSVTAGVAVPVISSVSPSVGSVAGGNQVFVNGSGFTGATAVRFGSASASFFAWSDTLITAFAPAHVAGTVDVTVSGPGGTSGVGSGTSFRFDPAANGGVQGRVTTEDGASAAGMLVVAAAPDTLAMEAVAVVAADGSFAFVNVAPGPYLVAVVGNASYKTKLYGFEFDPTAAAIGPATTVTVTSGVTNVLGSMALWRTTPKPSKQYDFTGDGKADVVWLDGNNGDWFIFTEGPYPNATKIWTKYGIPVAGDYDGDGRYEPANIVGSDWVTNGAAGTINFPQPATTNRPPSTVHDGPEAVPGMYDGNRTTEPAWYRQEDATWFIRGHDPIQFGSGPSAPTGTSQVGRDDYDRPVPADYDGDGRTDLAVWNPRTSTWKYRRSTDGVVVTKVLGGSYTYPAVGDYNGDGKAEVAFFNASGSGWQSDGFTFWNMPTWISPAAVATAPADYDGDGKTDRGWWDTPSTGTGSVQVLLASNVNSGAFPMWTQSGNTRGIPVEASYYRLVETAYLTAIWNCVNDPTRC